MHTIYRLLTLALVALAAVQVAALAWFIGGAVSWLEEGNALTEAVLGLSTPAFAEVHGLTVQWFLGSVAAPALAVMILGAAFAMRNELAIIASLAIAALVVAQAAIVNGVVEGLGAYAVHGALMVATAAIAAAAPKGAAWADVHRDTVRAVYAHTPLAA